MQLRVAASPDARAQPRSRIAIGASKCCSGAIRLQRSIIGVFIARDAVQPAGNDGSEAPGLRHVDGC